jgi:hypothetical protein
VFSPIALQEFDAQKYREFVQTLSDEALIREGKQMRWLSGDGKIREPAQADLLLRF